MPARRDKQPIGVYLNLNYTPLGLLLKHGTDRVFSVETLLFHGERVKPVVHVPVFVPRCFA